jgi:cytochrome bd-type quinol oxidase subunit 1
LVMQFIRLRSPKDWLILIIAVLFGAVNTYVLLYPILHSVIADGVMTALMIVALLSAYLSMTDRSTSLRCDMIDITEKIKKIIGIAMIIFSRKYV